MTALLSQIVDMARDLCDAKPVDSGEIWRWRRYAEAFIGLCVSESGLRSELAIAIAFNEREDFLAAMKGIEVAATGVSPDYEAVASRLRMS